MIEHGLEDEEVRICRFPLFPSIFVFFFAVTIVWRQFGALWSVSSGYPVSLKFRGFSRKGVWEDVVLGLSLRGNQFNFGCLCISKNWKIRKVHRFWMILDHLFCSKIEDQRSTPSKGIQAMIGCGTRLAIKNPLFSHRDVHFHKTCCTLHLSGRSFNSILHFTSLYSWLWRVWKISQRNFSSTLIYLYSQTWCTELKRHDPCGKAKGSRKSCERGVPGNIYSKWHDPADVTILLWLSWWWSWWSSLMIIIAFYQTIVFPLLLTIGPRMMAVQLWASGKFSKMPEMLLILFWWKMASCRVFANILSSCKLLPRLIIMRRLWMSFSLVWASLGICIGWTMVERSCASVCSEESRRIRQDLRRWSVATESQCNVAIWSWWYRVGQNKRVMRFASLFYFLVMFVKCRFVQEAVRNRHPTIFSNHRSHVQCPPDGFTQICM